MVLTSSFVPEVGFLSLLLSGKHPRKRKQSPSFVSQVLSQITVCLWAVLLSSLQEQCSALQVVSHPSLETFRTPGSREVVWAAACTSPLGRASICWTEGGMTQKGSCARVQECITQSKLTRQPVLRLSKWLCVYAEGWGREIGHESSSIPEESCL